MSRFMKDQDWTDKRKMVLVSRAQTRQLMDGMRLHTQSS